MKNKVKEIIHKIYERYYFYIVSKNWRTRYKNVDRKLFSLKVDADTLRQYKKKWSKFGLKVETETFQLCYNLSGKKNLGIVPENIFAAILEKRINRHKETSFFGLKNVYNKWYTDGIFPFAYFHKISGIYYDSKFNIIEDIYKYIGDSNFDYPIIVKPSKDTYGGVGVRVINSTNELFMMLNEFDYFVCQEKIIQNKFLSEINNSSLNTIRVCLLRRKDGEFETINSSIRFGINGGLDNETSGGIVCSIDNYGFLNEYAVDKFANKYLKHPNSNYIFKNLQIPFYYDLLSQSKKIANALLLCDLVSLDMSLDCADSWRCIEINVSGQTIRFAQYAGKPFFGEYTEEIIAKFS
ncbi:sugar-transfer associated ATP-grasp domain-containing protein [Sphingobacterium siyangense]|uniref:sugar-transfer associated ATP-grasp domain-containing protein n=1 Tax=Sphingobacterium siyangense TaxID=459529 RepID=UPI003DA2D213